MNIITDDLVDAVLWLGDNLLSLNEGKAVRNLDECLSYVELLLNKNKEYENMLEIKELYNLLKNLRSIFPDIYYQKDPLYIEEILDQFLNWKNSLNNK